MKEASKLRARWEREGLDKRYLIGSGIDIGCGDDPILPDADQWDMPQGDAQLMAGVPDAKYDWVFSSHCLEHLKNPTEALRNWWRILKPKGHLIVVVPDEDLYEQGIWPSAFNPEHKHTFTIHKDTRCNPESINILELITALPLHRVISIRVIDTGYKYEDALYDRTDKPGAEAAIELIVHKLPGVVPWANNVDKIIECLACENPRVQIVGVIKGDLIARCPHCGAIGPVHYD